MTIDRNEVSKMSGPELLAFYNGLPGVKLVKRFADRKSALARVLKALDAAPETPAPEPESNAAEQTAATPAPALDAAPQPRSKPKKAAAKGRASAAAYKAIKGGKEPRPESKRGQLLAILRDKGITIDAMMSKFGWTKVDCRDALRLLGKQNGIATKQGDDGKWHVV